MSDPNLPSPNGPDHEGASDAPAGAHADAPPPAEQTSAAAEARGDEPRPTPAEASAPESPEARAAAAAREAPAEAPAAQAAPAPTFDVLPLSAELRETLAEIGYVHPTPVQLAVWEPATRGRDAVVQARTGTGKTASFGLPIVDHIVKRSMAHAQVLALCPTRELALQVSREVERLGKRKGVKVTAIYGGAPMQRQIDEINAGAQVIVGTPGRVLDHLRRGTLNSKHIRLLVLDECDEMLSMGFERELSAILAELPPERQTLLFSATVPPDIERISKQKLKSPEFVTLSSDAVGALSIQHLVYLISGDKVGSFIRILEIENPESAIVFCNTRDETEALTAALKRQGYDADWLNGDLPQSDRERVMSATREGRLRFLVATDVAARGIDISHLTHVINYDFPQDAESYVHRTGRTGRAGRTGTAISLITPQDVGPLYILRLTYKIRPLERQIPTEGELKTRAEADLVAMLAEAFLPKGTHPDDLSLARRLLSHDQADVIVAGLLRDHLGARPSAQDEASAARRAAQPRPVPPPAPAAPRMPAPSHARGPRGGEHRAAPPAPAVAQGERDRGPRQEGYGERDRGPRQEGYGERDRGPRQEGYGERDRGPRHEGYGERDRGPRHEPRGGREALPPRRAPEPRRTDVAEVAPPDTERSREREREPERREREPERRERGDRGDRGDRGERGDRGDRRGGRMMEEARRRPADQREARDEAPASAEPATRPEPALRPLDRARLVEEPGDRRRDRAEARPAEDRRPGGPHSGARRAPLREDRPSAARGEVSQERPLTRHSDFITWQPPEEEGDDEPILAEPSAPVSGARAEADEGGRGPGLEADFGEIYVNIGRRDGARAVDFQRALVERADVAKDDVGRIRVRERNAFVSVRRAELARAVEGLNGAIIAGKEAHAEVARGRSPGAGEPEDAPSPPEAS